MADTSATYVPLLKAFVDGQMSPAAFCAEFLRMWRDDRDNGRASGSVIDQLMTAVDCYDDNPDEIIGGIDANQLHNEAAEALANIVPNN